MGRCETTRSERTIALKERASKVILQNPNLREVLIVQIDGCLVDDDTACDYLAQFNNCNHYIELKGADIEKTLRQIAASITAFNNKYNGLVCKAVISATRVPAISGFQRAFKRVKAEHPRLDGEFVLRSSGVTLMIE